MRAVFGALMDGLSSAWITILPSGVDAHCAAKGTSSWPRAQNQPSGWLPSRRKAPSVLRAVAQATVPCTMRTGKPETGSQVEAAAIIDERACQPDAAAHSPRRVQGHAARARGG